MYKKKCIKTSELCGFFRHLRMGVPYVNKLYNHLIFVVCAAIHFVNVLDFSFIGKTRSLILSFCRKCKFVSDDYPTNTPTIASLRILMAPQYFLLLNNLYTPKTIECFRHLNRIFFKMFLIIVHLLLTNKYLHLRK